ENRYHVSTYYEKEETSFYEYYADTSTYIKRTFTNNEYYDSEEIPMDYDTFYRTYVKLKYHSTLPDFNELKEYSFTNHHTLTPSAEAKITFNSEYYYEFIDDDIVISIKNITGKVTFSAPNGWKVYDITINGVDDSNCRYKLLWRYS
ncbi:MAG: hypothetical protein K2K50_06245, partial [Anaeroplasmataceae bacterium]|nr:hypothetical protein [Anaeroplasmataceae bacterium]